MEESEGKKSQKGTREDSKCRRLAKNRASAKESRLRKKNYMGNLEERNKVLEK